MLDTEYMRVNNLLNIITRRKWRRRDLNLRPTDPETDTLTTQFHKWPLP